MIGHSPWETCRLGLNLNDEIFPTSPNPPPQSHNNTPDHRDQHNGQKRRKDKSRRLDRIKSVEW